MSRYNYLLIAFCFAVLSGGPFACNAPATDSSSTGNRDSSQLSKNADYTQLAKDFCTCAEESISLNTEMQRLQKEGKRDEFIAMAPQVGKKFKAAIDCCRKIKDSATSASLDKNKLQVALNENCPDMPEKLSFQLSDKMQ